MRQVNWWLSAELIARLKDFQHAHRIDSLAEAARLLLREALDRHEDQPA